MTQDYILGIDLGNHELAVAHMQGDLLEFNHKCCERRLLSLVS